MFLTKKVVYHLGRKKKKKKEEKILFTHLNKQKDIHFLFFFFSIRQAKTKKKKEKTWGGRLRRWSTGCGLSPPLFVLMATVVMLMIVTGASPTTGANMAGTGNSPKCTRQEIMSCVFPVWKTLKTKYDLLRSTSRLEFTEADFGNVCATLLSRIHPCMRKLDATCDGYTLHALRSLNNTFKYMCNLGWGEFKEFRGCYANTTDPIVRNKVRQCYQKSGLAHRDFFDSEKDMYQAYQTDWWYRNRRDEFYQEHFDHDHPRLRRPSPNDNNNNNDHYDDTGYGQQATKERGHPENRGHPEIRGYPENRGRSGQYNYYYFQHPASRSLAFGYLDELVRYGIHLEDVYNYRDLYHRNFYDFGHMYPFPYGYPYGPYLHPYGHFAHHPYPWNHPAYIILHHQPPYGAHGCPWNKDDGGRGFTSTGNHLDGKEQSDYSSENHGNESPIRLRNYNYDTCKGFEMMLHCVNEFKNHCSKEGERWFIKLNDMIYQMGCLFLFCRYWVLKKKRKNYQPFLFIYLFIYFLFNLNHTTPVPW